MPNALLLATDFGSPAPLALPRAPDGALPEDHLRFDQRRLCAARDQDSGGLGGVRFRGADQRGSSLWRVCDFVDVFAHDGESWVATAFRKKRYAYPDLFCSIKRKTTSSYNVTSTNLTQQGGYDASAQSDTSETDAPEDQAGRGASSDRAAGRARPWIDRLGGILQCLRQVRHRRAVEHGRPHRSFHCRGASRSGRTSPPKKLARAYRRDRAANEALDAVRPHHARAGAGGGEGQRYAPAEGRSTPLEGIPLGIKDLFATKGVCTTACSHVLDGFTPTYQSTVTADLLGGRRGDARQDFDDDKFAIGSSNDEPLWPGASIPGGAKARCQARAWRLKSARLLVGSGRCASAWAPPPPIPRQARSSSLPRSPARSA